MNDIATEAGSTAPSLYTYFDGKQQILDGMLDDFSQSMLATFATEPSRSGSPKQKLEFLLRRQLRLIDEQRSVALVFAAERARASARSDRAFVLYVRALERWLRENLTAGYFGRFSPADAAFFIEGIAYAAFLRWADKGGKSRLERRASDVVSLFLFGVLGQDS
jgi:AcrR family transcriptional regulator